MLKTEAMRNYFFILFLLVGFNSCDDGDIIINNFDFEDATLTSCGVDGKPKVFFKINTDNIFESISLITNNSEISSSASILTTNPESEIRFNLDNNNQINYRVYDGTITSAYFCNSLPPSTPKVIQEFVSVGGTVVITTEVVYNNTDSDGDGIKDVDEEDGDTDEDGIPNKFDVDDDGDNVLTKNETATANNDNETANGYRDTDTDGTPNYLDDDDDGDGILTKNEVTAGDQSPTDPANFTNGLAFYLDVNVANGFEGVTYVLENSINVIYRSFIKIERLKLQNQDGSAEEVSFEVYNFGEFISKSTPRTIDPIPATEEN